MVGRVVQALPEHILRHMPCVVLLQRQERITSEKGLLVLVPKLNVSRAKFELADDVKILDEVPIFQ